MWWFALMMFTSPAFPFILFVCIGLSEAAPRVIPHNALTLSVLRKPREISEATVEHRNITIVNRFPEEILGIVSFTGLTPAPTVLPTSKTIHATAPSPTTIELPTTDPTTPSLKTTSTVGVQPAVFGQEIHGLVTLESNSATSVSSVRKTGQTMGSENSQGANNMSDIIATSDDSQELVCNCSSGGVLDPDECDRTTGQCVCLMGYTGLQCEECEEDHFPNGTARCLPCSCDSFGAVSPRCDSAGICVCKTGVYGPKCDDCHPGFFHFSATGCQPCQCNGHSTDCQPQSGICTDCQNNTQGQNCEECQVNFYRRHGDGVTDACLPCPCSPLTSTGSCHLDSGGNPACDQCKPGFSGASCDVCADGFRRSGGACVPCDCNGNADPNFAPQICHPETGRCHGCANHAAGAHCEICADGYTGDARAHNCTRRSVRVLFPEDPGTLIGATQESTTTTSAPSPSVTPLQTPTPSTTSAPAMSTTLLRLTSAPGGHGARTAPPDREDPMGNSTASALTVVSWTQFNIIILAVIIVMVVLLMGFVGGVYMYREYRNRKLNAPFWTIELKEDNISFSSYHDSIPHADPAGLLEEEPCVVAANGQLALATAANMYKA